MKSLRMDGILNKIKKERGVMELSADSKLLKEKTKPVINLLGWMVLLSAMVFSAKADMSFLLGFLFVVASRGFYSIVANGMLSFLITRKERELYKAKI